MKEVKIIWAVQAQGLISPILDRIVQPFDRVQAHRRVNLLLDMRVRHINRAQAPAPTDPTPDTTANQSDSPQQITKNRNSQIYI